MTRQPPHDLESLLMGDEGERLTVYPDSEGFLTISVGVCVDPRIPGAGLLPEESRWIFHNRAALAVEDCERKFQWFHRLSAPRRAVIASMRYQLGLPKLLRFVKFLEAVEKGDWSKAADEMRDSRWADQTPNRVNRLTQMMVEDRWI